jgi:gamma-glutamyltranspeptidase / glutathione hydrolase
VLRLSGGRVATVDFRETAPSAAKRDLFLDPQGNLTPGKSTVGYAGSGISGTVAGLATLKRSWSTPGSGCASAPTIREALTLPRPDGESASDASESRLMRRAHAALSRSMAAADYPYRS